MQIILVLHNIRSCYNVGAILRTAEGLGVKKVVLSGYTPKVNDDSLLPHLRDKLKHEIHKTALGAEDFLDIYASDDIMKDLQNWHRQGWSVMGLENNIKDTRLKKLGDPKLLQQLGNRIILILGEEVDGIDHSLYDMIDSFLEIPMQGHKESLNVSVAAGIALAFLLLK